MNKGKTLAGIRLSFGDIIALAEEQQNYQAAFYFETKPRTVPPHKGYYQQSGSPYGIADECHGWNNAGRCYTWPNFQTRI